MVFDYYLFYIILYTEQYRDTIIMWRFGITFIIIICIIRFTIFFFECKIEYKKE